MNATGAALSVAALVEGVKAGDRAAIARTLTLVESTNPRHEVMAQEALGLLVQEPKSTVRVGISGVPGVGKSTFIDALGMHLVSEGHRVAVLAVDPSSTRTGGSIMGDKTRMTRLAHCENAFVRPSPTAGHLGGVARATREAIVVMEAAGYDVVLVETVGVGQSEVSVQGMVDCFVLLALGRSGDQLQGIKKGVVELADVIAVNKADGDHEGEARQAARELTQALRLVNGPSGPTVPVLTCSALTQKGLADVWAATVDHLRQLGPEGVAARRTEQRIAWMWSMVHDGVERALRSSEELRSLAAEAEENIRGGVSSVSVAATSILAKLLRSPA